MKHFVKGCMLITAVSVILFLAIAPMATKSSAAQNDAPQSNIDKSKVSASSSGKPQCLGCSVDGKTSPRTRDGHPDLSGLWDNPFEAPAKRSADGSVSYNFGSGTRPAYDLGGHARGEQLSEPDYKPEYAAKVKAILDGAYGVSTPLDPQYDCKPLGVPRTTESPFQIVQTPLITTVLYEGADKVGQNFRIIYTDGRPHPEDLDTTYSGHSVGHWEGDTLVVDVAGLNDETWLGGGTNSEKAALIHSDQEHVVERYTRNGDILTYEATVEDPVMFTKPWVLTPRHFIHATADDELFENFCDARDKSHIIKPNDTDKFICNYCANTPKK